MPPGWPFTYFVISYTLPLIIIHKSVCVLCSATSSFEIILSRFRGSLMLDGMYTLVGVGFVSVSSFSVLLVHVGKITGDWSSFSLLWLCVVVSSLVRSLLVGEVSAFVGVASIFVAVLVRVSPLVGMESLLDVVSVLVGVGVGSVLCGLISCSGSVLVL